MDEETKKILKAILTKDLHELTENDKAFLRARVHYIGRKEREKFQEVLKAQPEAFHQKEDPEEGNQEESNNNPFPGDLDDGEDESTV